jgi:hypothetical protein
MSRYGPPAYTEDRSGDILANALLNVGTTLAAGRRQKRAEALQAEDRKVAAEDRTRRIANEDRTLAEHLADRNRQGFANALTDYNAGVRNGPIPNEMVSEAEPDPPTGNDRFATMLAGEPRPLTPPTYEPPTQPEHAMPGDQFAQMLNTVPSTPRSAAATGAPSEDRVHAATHPGAFDPATRQFGGSPLQQATAAQHVNARSSRYVPLDEGHYLDTTATPEARNRAAAESAADAASKRRIAEHEAERGFDAEHPVPTGAPRNIDPLSPEGITLGTRRAAAIAAAQAPFKKDPNAPPARPVTDGQRQAASMLPEIEDAMAHLDGVDPDLLSKYFKRAPIIGNYTMTDEGRQFQQIANQFINNTVYAKSGKAITDQEFKRLYNTYIPEPGDDAKTLERKRSARKLFIQGAYISAGGAAPNGPGGARTKAPAAAPPASANPWRK